MDTNTEIVIDIFMKELLKSAHLAKEFGLKHGKNAEHGRSVFSDSDKKCSDQFQQKWNANLSGLEVKFIISLSNRREGALSLLRKGAVFKGMEALSKCRYLIQYTNISKETFLIVDTFQSAAEAYLHYKTGEFSKAKEMILQSIESQRILNIEFNYDCEVRKIHLIINIIKILESNQKSEEVLINSCDLLRYVWLNEEKSPFQTDNWGHNEKLTIEEKLIFSDQIMNEIALLIQRKSVDSKFIVNYLKDLINKLSSIIEADKVILWLKTQLYFNSKNIDLYIKSVCSFFEYGPVFFHYSWKHLDSQISILDSQLSILEIG